MARYSPTVRAESYSPLAVALEEGLEGGVRGARLREEREQNQEGRYDRQRAREWEDTSRGRQRTVWERQDADWLRELERDPYFSTEPPEQRPEGPTSQAPEAGIRYGGERSVLPDQLPGGPERPTGPVPGQFVPGQGFTLPVREVQRFNAREARLQEPVAEVGETSIYRTGVTEDDLFARELERAQAEARALGEVDVETAGAREREVRRAQRDLPTPSERATMGNLELRRGMEERRREQEQREDIQSYANFFMQNRGGDVPASQFSRILQARYPDADAEMIDRIARDTVAGVGAGGEEAQDTELYDNIVELAPPTTPAQRDAARELARGRSIDQIISDMEGAGVPQTIRDQVESYLEQVSMARL